MTEAAEKPQAASEPPQTMEAIRAEIDAVDKELLALVGRRLSLADGLRAHKAAAGVALPLRPAREVQLIRQLIKAAPSPVDPDLVVELWRTLIAANVRRQAVVDVVVGGGGADQVRLHDIARRHFGARTRIERVPDPQTALMSALDRKNTVAVVPWLAAPGVGSWWPALSESRFHKLNLIAGLPMRGPSGDSPEAALFAAAPPEQAGEDVTLLIAFDPHHRLQRALNEVGLKGKEIARSEPRALVRIEGYLGVEDPRANLLTGYGLDAVRVLGSYARV